MPATSETCAVNATRRGGDVRTPAPRHDRSQAVGSHHDAGPIRLPGDHATHRAPIVDEVLDLHALTYHRARRLGGVAQDRVEAGARQGEAEALVAEPSDHRGATRR